MLRLIDFQTIFNLKVIFTYLVNSGLRSMNNFTQAMQCPARLAVPL